MIDLDVVILTWNDGDLLEVAARSVHLSCGVNPRLTVVDNGSHPPATLQDSRATVIRSETNLGVGRGRNLGVQHTAAPFVCFLDSDAQLHEDTLQKLLAPLLDDESVGLTAPVFAGQLPEASAGRAPTLKRKVLRALNRTDLYERMPGQGIDARCEVDFAIGACQVFRRSVFDVVGGLDETAAFGPEDLDFCLRVRGAGWRVVQVVDAACDHPPRRAFRGLATRRGLRHGRAVLRHHWRHRQRKAATA